MEGRHPNIYFGDAGTLAAPRCAARCLPDLRTLCCSLVRPVSLLLSVPVALSPGAPSVMLDTLAALRLAATPSIDVLDRMLQAHDAGQPGGARVRRAQAMRHEVLVLPLPARISANKNIRNCRGTFQGRAREIKDWCLVTQQTKAERWAQSSPHSPLRSVRSGADSLLQHVLVRDSWPLRTRQAARVDAKVSAWLVGPTVHFDGVSVACQSF